MRNAGLEEAQAEIKIARRNINNLTYADDTTRMVESEEELKSLLMRVKESERVGLKLNIQKTKIMASGSITSWETDGETVEIVSDFIFWGSKITADLYIELTINSCRFFISGGEGDAPTPKLFKGQLYYHFLFVILMFCLKFLQLCS